MFATLIQDTKRAAADTVKLAYIGAIIGILAASALFFFIFAGYHWAAEQFGPVAASLGLGIIFAAFAILFYAWSRMRRNAGARREEQRRDALRQALGEQFAIDPRWLPSTEAISTGVSVIRRLASEKRLRRLMPAVAPALALGVLVFIAYGVAQRGKTQQS